MIALWRKTPRPQSDIKALSKRFDLDGLESRKFSQRSQERSNDGCSANLLYILDVVL